MELAVNITVMSGVEDGTSMQFKAQQGDGQMDEHGWMLSIGRKEENDIVLQNDTYISRQHARLYWNWQQNQWWLEDLNSTNGTFLENTSDFFDDTPVHGIVHLSEGQLFRIGRTWMCLQTIE